MTFLPMLASSISTEEVEKYLNNNAWCMQPKADGKRICIFTQNGQFLALNRSGKSCDLPTHIVKELQEICDFPEEWLLDGELTTDGFYWVFDLPYLKGEIDSETKYRTRLMTLGSMGFRDPDKWIQLLPTYFYPNKQNALDTIIQRNGEGVVFKHEDGFYRPGERVNTMVKWKNAHDADVVVMDVGWRGKSNYCIGVYRDGELVEIGRVSAIGKPKLKVGDVIEVTFLHLGAGDRIVQPRITGSGPRTDKMPHQCDFSQLEVARVNKSVIV